MFSEWLGKGEPKGLEAVKNRILNEARRKAAPLKVFKDPNVVDPKVVAQAKAREADAARRAAVAKDRAAGNVDDPFQDASQQTTTQKSTLSLNPNTNLSGGGGTKPPTKPPVASAPEPEDDNPQFPGRPSLDDLLKSPIDRAQEPDFRDNMKEDLNTEISSMRDQISPLMDKVRGLMNERDEMIDDKQKPVRKYLQDLQDKQWKSTDPEEKFKLASMKANFALQAAMGQTFTGKGGRAGLDRAMNYDEVQQVSRNAERIREMIGNEDTETMRNFVASRKINDYPLEVAEMFYDSLPKELQKTLQNNSGKYGGGNERFYNPETGETETHDTSKLHYAGEGKRGKQTNRDRMIALMKTYLDQGGIDPYSGIPMNFDWMEMDHVIEATRPDEKHGFPLVNSWNEREHPDNFLWTSVGTNASKNKYGVGRLLDNALEKKDLKPEDFRSKEDQMSVKDQIRDSLIPLLQAVFPDFDPQDYDKPVHARTHHTFGENVKREMIDAIFDGEDNLMKLINDVEKSQGKKLSKSAEKARKELTRALGMKTDQVKTEFKGSEDDKDPTEDIGAKNQLNPNPTVMRQLINSFIGMKPDDQVSRRGLFNDASYNALRSTLEHTSETGRQTWEDDNNNPLSPLELGKDRQGNTRVGLSPTYDGYMIRNMFENGLLNVKEMMSMDSGRASSPQRNVLKKLMRLTGKSEEDLLK